jgi:hypothetical protein
MSKILETFEKKPPTTSKINSKGGDVEPIGADNAYKPSKDLSKDEVKLKKARGGDLNTTKKYSDMVKK